MAFKAFSNEFEFLELFLAALFSAFRRVRLFARCLSFGFSSSIATASNTCVVSKLRGHNNL
jgi:hypothetical protein